MNFLHLERRERRHRGIAGRAKKQRILTKEISRIKVTQRHIVAVNDRMPCFDDVTAGACAARRYDLLPRFVSFGRKTTHHLLPRTPGKLLHHVRAEEAPQPRCGIGIAHGPGSVVALTGELVELTIDAQNLTR